MGFSSVNYVFVAIQPSERMPASVKVTSLFIAFFFIFTYNTINLYDISK